MGRRGRREVSFLFESEISITFQDAKIIVKRNPRDRVIVLDGKTDTRRFRKSTQNLIRVSTSNLTVIGTRGSSLTTKLKE